MKKKAEESKHEKFVRLAEARTNKIIDTLQLLGNCLKSITLQKDDVEQIFQAIEIEVREAKRKFSKTDSEKSPRFTLR